MNYMLIAIKPVMNLIGIRQLYEDEILGLGSDSF